MPLDFPPLSTLCTSDCQRVFTYLSVGSLLMLIVSALALPWLIARLPHDFFQQRTRPPDRSFFCTLRRLIRNALALLLLLAGIAMLLLPGQGLLCIVMALALSDLPGKWRVLERLVSTPKVSAVLNWIRTNRGKPPFDL
ncbi:MAG: PGPGW domain-containing protein [Granulosicoccaceae bacterium]